MASFQIPLFGFVIFILVRFVFGLGLSLAPISRDLQFAVMLGLDADTVILNQTQFRKAVDTIVSAGSLITAEYADIPIDHDDPSVGTYKNRYWVSDKAYAPGGPVFVYDAGETNAESIAQFILTNASRSIFKNFVEEFHGVGIAWEHRYYGDSMPFPIDLATPPDRFKYLNYQQALADLPYFARNFNRTIANQTLAPTITPWIMVGGSYAGIRSAFTRDKYPDVIYAALASSAPVEARIDMSVYFDQVYRGMVSNGYGNCTKDLQAANFYIDQQLMTTETAADVKRLFYFSETTSNEDFVSALANIYNTFQSYGMGGGNTSLGSLCDYLERDPSSNATAGSNGLAPLVGNGTIAKRLANWPMLVPIINASNQVDFNLSKQITDSPSLYCWTWQYCSQWGYFQSDNRGSRSLLSRYLTLDYFQKKCYWEFPRAVENGLLPKAPQTAAVNNETGGWWMRPSNVFWSGGSFDPWRTLSPLSTEDIAPQGVEPTTEIPACNVETGEKQVFGYIMENAVHASDFLIDFAPGVKSRGYFTDALKAWLPCFKPDHK
ncbi:hypothetical protein Egran_00463 [Elaphomyces granulatus]|uniref:Serine carboxypeptidase S28 n=1 Tax=Elaphomyces granulatus TaxID=519963 RepID=A0A232M5W9_9EURO|nr:hypothetical protein Egran_00463 [Elaphomyces granulatus]